MRAARPPSRCGGPWLALIVAYCACAPAAAQESWNPFKPNAEQPRDRRPRPSEAAPLAGAAVGARERQPTLPASSRRPGPRPAAAASRRASWRRSWRPTPPGLPLELWRGLDLKTLEELLAGLELPPRSPALHQLWRRMLLSSATPPAGAPNDEHFVALRLEALYRSGLLADMETVLEPRRCARPHRADPARQARHRPRPARGRLPGHRGAGRAQLRAARPPQGRDAAARRLLRGRRQRCAGRRPRRRPRTRGRHRRRVAAGRAHRLCRRHQAEAGAAQARAAARLPVPGAAGPGQCAADLRQGRAGAARHARRRHPSRRAAADRRRRGGAAAQRAATGGRGGGLSAAAAVGCRRGRSGGAAGRSAAAARPVLPGRRCGARAGTARALPACDPRRCPPVRRLPADGARRGTAAGRPAAVARLAWFAETGRRDRAGRRRVRPGAPLGREPPACGIGWR